MERYYIDDYGRTLREDDDTVVADFNVKLVGYLNKKAKKIPPMINKIENPKQTTDVTTACPQVISFFTKADSITSSGERSS